MKKFLVMLMFVISVVGFGEEVVAAFGRDNYSNTDKRPGIVIIYDDLRDRYTVLRWDGFVPPKIFSVGDPFFAPDMMKMEDGGKKIFAYLKYKGKTYKKITKGELMQLLNQIGFYETER